MKSIDTKKGSGMIEVIIVSSIIVLVITTLIGSVSIYLRQSSKNIDDVKVGYLLEEGIEAVKTMRNNSWTSKIATLSNNSTYYLYFGNNAWSATTTKQVVDGIFTRTFILYPVYRDANKDIALSGTLDAGTKKLSVNVSWFDNSSESTTTKSISTYIANIYGN